MLIFQDSTMEKIRSHAQTEYPKECCGILLGRHQGDEKIAYSVIPTGNLVAEGRKTTHFMIAPLEIVKAEFLAEDKEYEIIGFYHSHPDYEAVASREDVQYMIAGYSYPIISVKSGLCAEVKSFEKIIQTDTDAKEEKILVKEN